jgi:ADP-ribosylglycohydrolase
MAYPEIPNLQGLVDQLTEYGNLKHEYGSEGVIELLNEAEAKLKTILASMKDLPTDPETSLKEPDELSLIRSLRVEGPRKILSKLDLETFRDKLEGAFLARIAGCTLGSIVELWSVEEMEKWAEYIGDTFPPVDYWSSITYPNKIRYGKSYCFEYTREKIKGVPVDDDIMYTILGLLVVEESGLNFSTEDVAKVWHKYMQFACTAEEVALKNISAGFPAIKAAEIDNPYCQWIGADIRSDPWAYIAPGYPEKAAEMAYYDAFLSHRRNGIYGEMFFSAAQSAAFTTDNAIDAIKIGMTEIPRECALYKDIEWALEVGEGLKNYKDARAAVDERFKSMNPVHTNNNACLTVFGLMIGGNDVTKVISETVAMGLDNDCTAATAGSIVGAIVGKKGVPVHWYQNFNNKIHSFLKNNDEFEIDDVLKRFAAQAQKVFS